MKSLGLENHRLAETPAFLREFQSRRRHIQHVYLNLAGPSDRGHTVTASMQGMDGTSARVIYAGKTHKFK